MDKKRVAVIAVHGVADQAPGATARTLVELLVSSPPPLVDYRAVSSDDVTMQVPPLAPLAASTPASFVAARAAARSNDDPKGGDGSSAKAFAQSLRSDFHHESWQAPHLAAPLLQPKAMRAALLPEAAQLGAPDADRGIEVTSYLLTKHIDNGARPEAYQTTRVELTRRQQVGAQHVESDVHVYEMYWADLSRLSGTMPRIVSELFTLVFRLSKLGRETVEEMRGVLAAARAADTAPAAKPGHPHAWTVASALQSVLDWMLVNGLALLFTQLAWMAIVFFAIGLISGTVMPPLRDKGIDLHVAVACAIAALALLRILYSRGEKAEGDRPRGILAALVLALEVGCLVFAHGALPWLTVIAILALLTWLNETILRIAEDRFPFVHVVGRWMWIATMVLLLAAAAFESATTANGWRVLWLHSTMFVTEIVLDGVKWWWIVAGVALVPWFVAGLSASRDGGYAGKASIATGRLGFAISLCMFVATTMSAWAMLNDALYWSVADVGYTPCVFGIDAPTLLDTLPGQPARVGLYAANACLFQGADAHAAALAWAGHGPTIPTARYVLQSRYERSTAEFSVLAVLLVGLLLYLAITFVPSIMAELKLLVNRTRNAFARKVEARMRARATHDPCAQAAAAAADKRVAQARELGRWLTTGYRWLDALMLVFTSLGVAICAFIAASFIDSVFSLAPDASWYEWIESPLSDASQVLLKPLIFSAASLGAALTLFGGALSRYLPALRAPLDVALDVDNHFREFPRTDIPRAHIFSRFAALLDHVSAAGYDRVVIVAHSQGAVIATELLRFLSSRDLRAPTADDRPRHGSHAIPEINLLTAGCPLRQLYAARFPSLYAWVTANNGNVFGPRAIDVGVQRWMNAFCSGDYVGRWLWSKAKPFESLAHPLDDAVCDEEPFGRKDVYTGFNPSPPSDAHLDAAREVEVCLGLGAHTHYFERDQSTVAWMIDYLIRARPVQAATAPAAGVVATASPVVQVDARLGQPGASAAIGESGATPSPP